MKVNVNVCESENRRHHHQERSQHLQSLLELSEVLVDVGQLVVDSGSCLLIISRPLAGLPKKSDCLPQ